MSSGLRGCLWISALALTSCGLWPRDAGWRGELAKETAQLGHRNWIVIAEASFPAHSRSGLRQITADEEIPAVVDAVLRELEQTEHVTPRIYLTREMRSVENDYAPGIEEFRKQLRGSLHGHESMELEQQSLYTMVEDVTKSYEVLVIRTPTALPYTSVFLELQPGYWSGESESHLREKMEKLARPAP
jgi:D-ribose pyranose/furanose isomerase RbsD